MCLGLGMQLAYWSIVVIVFIVGDLAKNTMRCLIPERGPDHVMDITLSRDDVMGGGALGLYAESAFSLLVGYDFAFHNCA